MLLFIEILISNMLLGLEAIFMMLYLTVLQKVLFLEYHTEKQDKKMRKIVLYVVVGWIVSLILTNYTKEQSTRDVIYLVGAIIIVVTACGTILYGSFIGRKRAKWLAIFEIIPMVGYFYGFQSILDNVYGTVNEKKGLLWADLSEVGTYTAILLLYFLMVKKNAKFLRNLARDIQNRSLTVAEEIIVWAVGIWLFVSNDTIGNYIERNSSGLVTLYVTVLNFLVALVIVMFVITSNYRDYYNKKNSALQKSLITTMADLVENRDENTGGHIHRTSKYVEIIARKLQEEKKYSDILTDQYIENMIIAAPLHDVGKIHIPDAILNKPGKLDEEEFDTMKSHAAKGGEIIEKVEENTGNMDYLNIAKEMAEYHHERMDGKGYPYGISGEEIPLCAKILAVADVFDALSSKRCYKEAMPLDKAFAIIEMETGDHFDEEIANAFLACREEVEVIIRESSED